MATFGRSLRGLALLVLTVLVGCVSNSVPARRSTQGAPGANLTVDSGVLLAPGRPTADTELEDLEGARSNAAMLRRAFLLLEVRRPDAALDAAAQVLYGPSKPSANEEAFARYARAEAFAMLGRPDQGQYDRDVARQLALDGELQRRLRPSPAVAADTPLPTFGSLEVIGRAQWQPRSPDRRNLEPMGRPSRLTIHHSAMYFRDTSTKTAAAQIQRIQRDHMQNRSYGDIGYHYLIDPSGRVWEGRELRYQGAHATGANNVRNIGICLLGNFVRGGEGHQPSPAQVGAMRELVVSLMQRYGFGAEGLFVHNDFKATECPGPLLEPVVAEFGRELRRSGVSTAASAPPR